jgi:hypothetical protein
MRVPFVLLNHYQQHSVYPLAKSSEDRTSTVLLSQMKRNEGDGDLSHGDCSVESNRMKHMCTAFMYWCLQKNDMKAVHICFILFDSTEQSPWERSPSPSFLFI